MVCKKCGEVLPDYALKCPVCGALQGKSGKNGNFSKLNPGHSHEDDCSHWDSVDKHSYIPREDKRSTVHTAQVEPSSSVGVLEAVTRLFTRMLDFRGVATRREFWIGFLVIFLLSGILGSVSPEVAEMLSVVIMLPYFSLSVRRLHDTDRTGWWFFVVLIPAVGQILFLVLMCLPSKPDSRWRREL